MMCLYRLLAIVAFFVFVAAGNAVLLGVEARNHHDNNNKHVTAVPVPTSIQHLPKELHGSDAFVSYNPSGGFASYWVFVNDNNIYRCDQGSDGNDDLPVSNCTAFSNVIPKNLIRSGFDTIQRGICHVENYFYIIVANGENVQNNQSALVVLDITQEFSSVFMTILPVRTTWLAAGRAPPASSRVHAGGNKAQDSWLYVGTESPELILTFVRDGKGVHPIGSGLKVAGVEQVVGATLYDLKKENAPELLLLSADSTDESTPLLYAVDTATLQVQDVNLMQVPPQTGAMDAVNCNRHLNTVQMINATHIFSAPME